MIHRLRLRTKLALVTGLATLAVSTLAAVLVIEDLVSTAAERAIDDVALAVDDLVLGLREDPGLADDELAARSGGTRLRIIDLQSGDTIAISPEVRVVRRSAPESVQIDVEADSRTAAFPSDTRLVASQAVTVGDGRRLRVDGARDDGFLTALRQDLISRAIPAVPAVGLLAALAAWLLAGRALAPVAGLAARAARIDDESRAMRLPVPDSGDEIADLAAGLNRMLDRLQAGRDREEALVGDVSHELRNPLAALITRLESASAIEIGQTDGYERRQGHIDHALADARRLARLTDDLLEIASLDSTLGPEARPVDLFDIVEAASTEVSGVEITGRAPLIHGDPLALVRMLSNVVGNARVHGREPVQVTLSEGPDGAIVTVDDHGPGVPPEDRVRIFDRFVRLDDGRDRRCSGTGLGLALVAATVRRHGGHVSLTERAAGPGARVVITLPAAEKSAANSPPGGRR